MSGGTRCDWRRARYTRITAPPGGLDWFKSQALPHPPREEHILLFKTLARARAEGDTAREQELTQLLVRRNLGLVFHRAHALRRLGARVGLKLEDLIAEGCGGLLRAIAKFDPERGFAFSSYSIHWVHQFIRRAIDNAPRGAVRVPVHTAHALLGWGPAGAASLEAARLAQVPCLRLDAPHPSTPEGEPLGSFIRDPAVDLDEVAELAWTRRRVERALSKLPPRHRQVLELRFGLDGHPERTLDACGEQLGVTRERARQIEKKALRQLREVLTTTTTEESPRCR